MNRTRKYSAVLGMVLAGILVVAGCGSDDDTVSTKKLELHFDGLEQLGDGFVYEGWLIVDGAAVSSGRFSLGVDQSTVTQDVQAELLDAASTVVLTIEPASGDDPAPSDVHVLAGDIDSGVAELSASHAAALGDDFLGASGVFILETPSSMVADDYELGIWWLDPAGPAAGLNLPLLPAGWAYEGWIVGADGPVSTGRFTDASVADSDGAGPTAGSDGAPPFPGQDFISPSMNLVDSLAVISVEPEPDDSAGPFAFKPLMGDVAREATRTLVLTFDGLEPLGMDYVYEGWLIVDGQPVTAGRFSITDGQTEAEFELDADDLTNATTFVLTIEPATGDDPAPADTHVLAGDFGGDQASLSVVHPAALGNDFLDAGGAYILETPSTSMVANDFDQGIWWLNPDGPQASLMLPMLPAGWVYEGWIVTADGPISTGRFQSEDMADFDGAGSTSGPDMAPPFPGQDLIDPAVNLIGTTAVISIEPEPDDSPAPFAFKPLTDTVDDVAAGVLQSMSNNADTFPGATAVNQRRVLVQGMNNRAADFPSGTATIR